MARRVRLQPIDRSEGNSNALVGSLIENSMPTVLGTSIPSEKQTPLALVKSLKRYETSSKDIYDQMTVCFNVYKHESFLSTAIDILHEFSITNMFIENLPPEAQKLIEFWRYQMNYENQNVEQGLDSLLSRQMLAYFIFGNVFPYDQWKFMELDGKKFLLPMTINMLNPHNIEIPDESASLSTRDVYYKLPDSVLSILRKQPESRTQTEKKVIKGLPKEFLKNIDRQGRFLLDDRFVSHIKRKELDFVTWGIPYLLKVIGVLSREKNLERLDTDTIDGIINRIVAFKVGNPDNPGRNVQAEVNNFSSLLKNPGKTVYLVWGPYLDKVEVGPDSRLLQLTEKYDSLALALFDALGIPVNLFSGRFTSQGERDSISVLSLQERLEKPRKQIERWLHRLVMKILSVNHDLLGINNGVNPYVKWSTIRLKDPEAQREFVTTFYDRGLLSAKTALVEAGYNIDVERRQRKEEVKKGDDILFTVRPIPSVLKDVSYLHIREVQDEFLKNGKTLEKAKSSQKERKEKKAISGPTDTTKKEENKKQKEEEVDTDDAI